MSADKKPRIIGVSADDAGVRLAVTYDGLRSDDVDFVTLPASEAAQLAADLLRAALPVIRRFT